MIVGMNYITLSPKKSINYFYNAALFFSSLVCLWAVWSDSDSLSSEDISDWFEDEYSSNKILSFYVSSSLDL